MIAAGRPAFLVGFMGSGKTSVGRIVAASWGREFVDTDDLVVERAGESIDSIFRVQGEGTFRRLEQEALESLEGRGGPVVATGGGLFLGLAQRRWMAASGLTIWLDAPLEVCERRVGPARGRPLWPVDDRLALRTLYEKRRATYALAAVRVEASGDPREVSEELLRRIEGDFR